MHTDVGLEVVDRRPAHAWPRWGGNARCEALQRKRESRPWRDVTPGLRMGAFVALGVLLAGCNPLTFHILNRNVADIAETVFLSGDVSHAEVDSKSVIVFALQERAGRITAYNYVHLPGPGRFVLRLAPGEKYWVGAFADRNGNLRPDPGEPFGLRGEALLTTAENQRPRLALALHDEVAIPKQIAGALGTLASLKIRPLPIAVGDLASLDDERFSEELGVEGLWAPFDYLVQAGSGIYFLHPYDPKKIPVVFVAGAGGYPRQWERMIAHLDTDQYQPWLFAYPSGMRLDASVRILNGVMNELQKRYRFNCVYVVAHSMGGLVARGFIQRSFYTDHRRFVRLLVTLSTPWSGHAAAWMGVALSPVTVPSWIDMQVDSDYQRAIFAQPLGGGIPYYLFFSHLGADYRASGADDGTVSVASQLRPEAIREATEIVGLPGSHDAILTSDDSVAEFARIMGRAGACE